MQPQHTALLNTSYFDAAIAEINGCNLCGNLQAMVARVMASLQAEIAGIKATIDGLIPLITIPTDLGSVITWITHFAAPLQAAHATYLAQLAALVAKVTALTTAINNAISRIVGCSVSVPTITF